MPDMHSLLNTLHLLLPAQGLVHIGAGLPAQDTWYRSWALPFIDWIDADEQRHQWLAKSALSATGEGHRQSHHALLGAECKQAQFHVLSNPQESGLLEVSALTQAWPNISAVGERTLEQTTFDALAAQHLPHRAHINWLYIECLPAVRVAQGAREQLQYAEVILARVVARALPASHPLAGQGATQEELSAHLQPQGYRWLASYEERNPAFATAVYVRDYPQAKAELLQKHELLAQAQKALEADLAQNRKALADAQAAHSAAQQAAQAEQAQQAQAITALTQACDAEAKAKAELLQKHELLAQAQKALEADLAKNRKALADAQAAHEAAQKAAQAEQAQQAQAITALTQARDAEAKAKQTAQQTQTELEQRLQKLQPLSQSIEMLSQELKKQNTELSEKISKQNTELTNLRQQLESTVKKEILNATQQLEAFLNIQSFFTHGEHQPIMHGWPISPDFALYLIGLLEKNDYDLILEFGSGTSTVIMAKALARLQRQDQSKPAVVQIAFEHLEQYHTQTLANLQSAGVADAVEIVLAPLQPYKAPNENTYSYYACQDKLTELAHIKQAPYRKILVVVDGPPGSTGKHARYPALPIVLTYFKNSQIDFVLDDYFRDDEKEVGALWIKECELAGLKAKTETIKMEKDAFFVSVQPK